MKTVINTKRICRTITSVLLAAVMVLGAAAWDAPSVAASEFKYASPFSHVGKSMYYHNGRFTGNVIVNGVDISAWQSKKCDFKKAKADGVDFAILRVTYTNTSRAKKFTTNLDTNFASQYKRAKAAGMMTGIYVFSQARNSEEAVKEAKYAVKRLKALGIGPEDLSLPVYMDYEFSGGVFGRLYGLDKTDSKNAAAAFCNTIKSYGYQPGIYANTTFFKRYIDPELLADDVDLWCAQYYSRCESGVPYSKWQYSSSARIDGLLYYTGWQGNIDVNFWYLDDTPQTGAVTEIHGKTVLSVRDAAKPKFKIYDNGSLLTEGVDYIVGGIRNNAKGKGYAYIKGIGRYGGYALVPITIKAKTSGSANKLIEGKAANHMTYASAQQSQSVPDLAEVPFEKGVTYTVQTPLNIRKGAGTKYAIVKRSKLSKAMKKKTYSGTYAVLKEGTKIKCKKVKGDWIKIDGGWVCGRYDGEDYIR